MIPRLVHRTVLCSRIRSNCSRRDRWQTQIPHLKVGETKDAPLLAAPQAGSSIMGHVRTRRLQEAHRKSSHQESKDACVWWILGLFASESPCMRALDWVLGPLAYKSRFISVSRQDTYVSTSRALQRVSTVEIGIQSEMDDTLRAERTSLGRSITMLFIDG